MPRRKTDFSETYCGVKISQWGRKLVATMPLARGQGRKRKSATATKEGLAALEKWVDGEIKARACVRQLTAAENADAVAALATLPGGVTLLEAAQAWCRSAGTCEPITIGEAREAYLSSLAAAGRRPATVSGARNITAALLPFAELAPDALTFSEAEKIVRARKSAVTQNNVRRVLGCFFNWMKRRKYASANPFAEIEKAFEDERGIAAYSPADTARLFAEAEEKFPEMVAAMALSFFAGVRTSGLDRMRPEDVRLESGEICLPGWASKTRRAYYAPISPTLGAWLAAYPPRAHGPRGAVLPFGKSRWHARSRALHAAAGVAMVPNGGRHSFATYTYALEGDAMKTAAAMGHFGDAQTLVRHYRALADRDSAVAYFGILPRGEVGSDLVPAVSREGAAKTQKTSKTQINSITAHQ